MKKVVVFGLLLWTSMFCFAKELNSQEISINETVSMVITGIKNPVNSVVFNEMVYRPKDSKNDTMAEVVFYVTNNGSERIIDIINLKDIELVCSDKDGNLSVSSWDSFIENKNKIKDSKTDFLGFLSPKDEYDINPGSSFKKTVHFIHSKNITPVAFTQNRKVIYSFYDIKSKNSTVIAENLIRIEKFYECIGMVKSSSSEEIVKFMNEYNITFSDEDRKGFTLLYYAIGFNNNEFLDVAIQQKSDTKHLITYSLGMMKLNPIQYAVKSGNSYAVNKLIEMGEELFFKDSNIGIRDIGAQVIEDNNVLGAKILYEYGYDFSSLIIGGGWLKKQTAIEYAESQKYFELLSFLKSVVK